MITTNLLFSLQGYQRRRLLEADDNVYLVQLAWKGGGRLILEEKEKLSVGGYYHSDLLYANNPHLNLSECRSEPMHLGGKVSPRIRRSSKMIASGVRRISRSFYGGGGHGHQHQDSSQLSVHHNVMTPTQPSPKPTRQRRMTTAAAGILAEPPLPSPRGLSPAATTQDCDKRMRRNSACSGFVYRQEVSDVVGEGADGGGGGGGGSNGAAAVSSGGGGDDGGGGGAKGSARKLSKVNLRKLKIW
jgi:hypothetical protein